MKKFILLSLIGWLILVTAGCDKKKEQYMEEKLTLEGFIQSTTRYIRELEVTNNRIAVGRVIKNYIDDIKRIKQDMWALEKICPDFKTTYGYKNAPKELRPLIKRCGESLARMKLVAEGKMSQFSTDKNLLKMFAEVKEVLYYY